MYPYMCILVQCVANRDFRALMKILLHLWDKVSRRNCRRGNFQNPLGGYSLVGNPSTNSLIKVPLELRKGTSHPYQLKIHPNYTVRITGGWGGGRGRYHTLNKRQEYTVTETSLVEKYWEDDIQTSLLITWRKTDAKSILFYQSV
jgi:hypothetical protein